MHVLNCGNVEHESQPDGDGGGDGGGDSGGGGDGLLPGPAAASVVQALPFSSPLQPVSLKNTELP